MEKHDTTTAGEKNTHEDKFTILIYFFMALGPFHTLLGSSKIGMKIQAAF